MPHHVTHRGNRRQQTFFGEEDYQHYLDSCRDSAARAGRDLGILVDARSCGDTIPNAEKLSIVSPELMSRFRKVVTGWIHDACSCD